MSVVFSKSNVTVTGRLFHSFTVLYKNYRKKGFLTKGCTITFRTCPSKLSVSVGYEGSLEV